MTRPAVVEAMNLESFDARRLVSANRRIHHHVRAETCRYWREVGRNLVAFHYGTPEDGAWLQRARIVVTFRFPTGRVRDCMNLYPYVVKPLVDGMVTDAGLLPGDDDRYLIGPDIRRDLQRRPHRITVDVEPLP